MLLPQRRITFTRKNGDVIIYDFVCETEIYKSYQNLTNTAKVIIPRKLTIDNSTVGIDYVVGADALFARGDQIKIENGYYPNLETKFEGYLNKVKTTLPIEIDCEDKMWLLKQYSLNYPSNQDPNNYDTRKEKGSYFKGANSITLKQLLDIILKNSPNKIEYKTIDDNINLGKWLITNQTAAKVLEILKDRYGLYSYFKDDGILYVGWANDATNTNTQTFIMEENVINNDTLEYVNATDVKIKIHGVSMNSDNTKIEYDAGDPSGDLITKFTYNQDMAGLKKFVDELLPTVKYTGFRGVVKTFLEPAMNHGDIANIKSYLLPERNGNYLIKGVRIFDGHEGAFQELELGIKI